MSIDTIFVHIPKTGGTSIKKGLGIEGYKHLPWFDIKCVVGEAFWDEAYKFTVVRNPWEHAVSWFFHAVYPLTHGKRVRKPEELLNCGFAEWVAAGCPSPPQYGIDALDQLGRAGYDLDDYYKFEELARDWRLIRREHTQTAPTTLPHEHTGFFKREHRPSAAQLYTVDTVAMIYRREEELIEMFGYEPPE